MVASRPIVWILALCLLSQVICREVSLPTLSKASIRRLVRVRGGARGNDRRYGDVRKANVNGNYNRASDDASPRYRPSTYDAGRYEDDYDGREREPYVNEVVASYTQSAAGKALVAVSAGKDLPIFIFFDTDDADANRLFYACIQPSQRSSW